MDAGALVILPSVRGSSASFRATTPDGCHCTVMLFTMRRAVAAAVAAVGGAGATDTCSIVLLLTSFSACRPGIQITLIWLCMCSAQGSLKSQRITDGHFHDRHK